MAVVEEEELDVEEVEGRLGKPGLGSEALTVEWAAQVVRVAKVRTPCARVGRVMVVGLGALWVVWSLDGIGAGHHYTAKLQKGVL